jgi:hypothetical protein
MATLNVKNTPYSAEKYSIAFRAVDKQNPSSVANGNGFSLYKSYEDCFHKKDRFQIY